MHSKNCDIPQDLNVDRLRWGGSRTDAELRLLELLPTLGVHVVKLLDLEQGVLLSVICKDATTWEMLYTLWNDIEELVEDMALQPKPPINFIMSHITVDDVVYPVCTLSFEYVSKLVPHEPYNWWASLMLHALR